MARHYIPIDTVDDIDVSRVSLASINNRYVDKSGARYATRFNKRTRKIDIVRVALGQEEAMQAKVSHIGNKFIEKPIADEPIAAAKAPSHPAPYKLPSWVAGLGVAPDENIDAKEYFMGLEREAEKMSERIRGVISNLKNSEEFNDKKDSNKDFILELTTSFDREVQEFLAKTQNKIVEFQRFPKPNSYYVGTLERRQKIFVEKLNTDAQKEYFKALYVSQPYLAALHGCLTILDSVDERISEVNPERLAYDKRQFLENAKTTSGYLREIANGQVALVLGWLKKVEVI